MALLPIAPQEPDSNGDNSDKDERDLAMERGLAFPPADFSPEPETVEALPYPTEYHLPEPEKPLYIRLPNGWIHIKELPDLDSFTPEFRAVAKNNVFKAMRMLARYEGTDIQRDVERVALGKMRTAQAFYLPPPGLEDSIETKAAQAGMSVSMARYFAEHDPDYLENEIVNRGVMAMVGPNGFTTKLLQTDRGVLGNRYDHLILAQIEAQNLAIEGDWGAMIRYDVSSGFGQVGAFGIGGAAAVAKAIDDVLGLWQYVTPHDKRADLEKTWLKSNVKALADWLEQYAEDAQAMWVGPPIDTGNPKLDFIRTSIFRGGPMLAAFAALAAIAYVGTKTYCRPKTNRRSVCRTSS